MKSLGLCLLILVLSCRKDYNDNPLAQILESNHPAIRTVMDQLETHELQIKVSKLITYNNNDLRLSTYNFQVADSNYFYPASTVKFPIAILALEKANSIKEINSDTPFIVEGDSIFTTIKENVNAIFAVSDNAAYNRLYEFLGRDYIHTKLREKGLQPAQIVHRLESDDAENSTRKAIIFKLSNALQYIQPADIDSEIEPLKLHRLKKGKGYYKNDELIKKPMDFSKKNYLPISTLHDIMKRIQYPNAFNKEEQFTLSNEDYEFLWKAMKTVPRKLGYDEREFYDGYVKFFILGDTKERLPDDLHISNKVGYAYGYLTDCAFIEDRKNGISFLITATIHVNKNEIFNDDIYEYESIGIPFLAELGRQLHQYYLNKTVDLKRE